MAEKLPVYGKGLYNSKGEVRWCNNEAEVRQARTDGFTNNYVKSNWPTTVHNRKTGESKPVGRLEWTEEQNKAAVAALGDEWTREFVAIPEIVERPAQSATADSGLLVEVLMEIRSVHGRLEEVEEAVSDLAGARTATESRLVELEGLLAEATEPSAKAGPEPAKGKPKATPPVVTA